MRPLRLAALALLGAGLWVGMPAGQQSPAAPRFVEGEVLVRFRGGASPARRTAALAGIRGRRLRRFEAVDADQVRLSQGTRVEEAMALLQAHPDVAAVQPNYVRTATFPAPPDDTHWLNGNLWGMERIQAQPAWNAYGAGDGTVVVAIIDTGIHYAHPDLAANMWQNPGEIAGNLLDDDGNGYVDDRYGIDTINHDSDPFDDHGHGTHTAGTVGAVGNNGRGVTGVNWNVKLLACKFLAADGSGTDAGAIECLNYVTALRNRGVNIRVTNNSWGAERGGWPLPQLLKDAFDAAGDAGILHVAAAGNGGADGVGDNTDLYPHDPSSFTSPSIVSVAASDQNDQRASFSNFGATSVDLAAPGVSILSTWVIGNTSYYRWLSGTSMATPHVAGAAALLASRNPGATVAGLRWLLLNHVAPIASWSGVVATGGRLDVFQAAQASANNSPPTVALTSPANATIATAPAVLTLSATAADATGVSRVDFHADGVPVGTDASSPYSVSLASVPGGVHRITATAVDLLGAGATSAAARVIVVTPGIVDDAAVGAAVTRGGSRLQALQNPDGGWVFRVGDADCGRPPAVSCANIFGVTALGLLSEYARSGEPSALADAVEAGNAIKLMHAAALLETPPGLPRFQDLEFLVALTEASGDTSYAETAAAWFEVVLARYPDAAGRVDDYLASRGAGGRPTVAAWDTASLIRSAKAVGHADYALAAAARILAREAEWKDVDPAHRFDQCATPAGCGPSGNPLAFDHTLLAMGSLLWALHDLPGFDATIAAYRAHLLAQQDPGGSWDVGDAQITAYVMLGLAAVGGEGTDAALQSSAGFLLTHQNAVGGWPAYVMGATLGGEYTEVDAEVIRALDTRFNTPEGEAVSVAPAQLATLQFDRVSTPGATTVVALDIAARATPPAGYTIVGRLTYDLSTTAGVSGGVSACFSVPWSAIAARFDRVRILHEERGVLADRTVLDGPLAPNPTTRRVCAAVPSLAAFAVAVREPAVDATPPRLDVDLTPAWLSPANGRLRRVVATVRATDEVDPAPEVALVSITIGRHGRDAARGDVRDAEFGADDREFVLRAVPGRVYAITYRATDRSGNATLATARVRVVGRHSP